MIEMNSSKRGKGKLRLGNQTDHDRRIDSGNICPLKRKKNLIPSNKIILLQTENRYLENSI